MPPFIIANLVIAVLIIIVLVISIAIVGIKMHNVTALLDVIAVPVANSSTAIVNNFKTAASGLQTTTFKSYRSIIEAFCPIIDPFSPTGILGGCNDQGAFLEHVLEDELGIGGKRARQIAKGVRASARTSRPPRTVVQ